MTATIKSPNHPIAKSPDAPPSAMRPIDLSTNPRVQILMDMVRDLSQAADAHEVLRAFGEGLVKLNGPRGYVSLSTRGLAPGEYKITRLFTDDMDLALHAADPWTNWESIPIRRGGLLGEIVTNGKPQLFHHVYLKNDPVVGNTLDRYGSLMAIPLFENGQALNWAIILRPQPEGFTVEELEESILRSNLGGATVRNVRIASQLRHANETIHAEVEQIGKIQRALLPQQLPNIPGLKIAASYETYDTAGGDLYDFIVLPRQPTGPTRFDGWLAMLIADASGHGPAAAVLAAMLNTLLYAYPRRGDGPADVFSFANRHLHSKKIEGTFVTAMLAVYNPVDHTLIYANAGHNPPLIKNAGSGGAVQRLDEIGGIPLGISAEAEYENGIIKLQPGQTFVMYTDGITEAMNPQRRMFGVEGLERALHECSGEPDCIITSVNNALLAHQAGRRPSDDQTIVAVKVV